MSPADHGTRGRPPCGQAHQGMFPGQSPVNEVSSVHSGGATLECQCLPLGPEHQSGYDSG